MDEPIEEGVETQAEAVDINDNFFNNDPMDDKFKLTVKWFWKKTDHNLPVAHNPESHFEGPKDPVLEENNRFPNGFRLALL